MDRLAIEILVVFVTIVWLFAWERTERIKFELEILNKRLNNLEEKNRR